MATDKPGMEWVVMNAVATRCMAASSAGDGESCTSARAGVAVSNVRFVRRVRRELSILSRLLPNPALVHQLDLLFDDLLPVLSVLHRLALEIQVLRVNRLFVDDLVTLGAH